MKRLNRFWTEQHNRNGTHLPARPAICRACDVLMVSMCFSPLSFMLGFMRLLKMILFILLETETQTMRGMNATETMNPMFHWEKQYSVHGDTYRLRPIPIASVATSILQGSSGSLNFLACDSLVPVNHTLILRFVSFFFCSRTDEAEQTSWRVMDRCTHLAVSSRRSQHTPALWPRSVCWWSRCRFY